MKPSERDNYSLTGHHLQRTLLTGTWKHGHPNPFRFNFVHRLREEASCGARRRGWQISVKMSRTGVTEGWQRHLRQPLAVLVKAGLPGHWLSWHRPGLTGHLLFLWYGTGLTDYQLFSDTELASLVINCLSGTKLVSLMGQTKFQSTFPFSEPLCTRQFTGAHYFHSLILLPGTTRKAIFPNVLSSCDLFP